VPSAGLPVSHILYCSVQGQSHVSSIIFPLPFSRSFISLLVSYVPPHQIYTWIPPRPYASSRSAYPDGRMSGEGRVIAHAAGHTSPATAPLLHSLVTSDLWWTNWCWGRFSSGASFSLSIIFLYSSYQLSFCIAALTN
jgi:hypothetical protein